MSHTPQNMVVWAEIPVTDMARSIAFYSAILETELTLDDGGPNPMAVLPTADKMGVAGHLYPGKPAPEGTGSTIHLACPGALAAARTRVEKAGGKVVSGVLEIPDGMFFYCQDPDGNSIGLFTR
ncbi:VOC family protein [Thalassospiraceae bacterium LMO-SO8]|nr:VOC family protein [Alphaproteobacteria bacterium LMO-S08]WND74687.1 VOC family protein [Thalassospiraceae bacterium LMO-SO8]